jgi:hypothetical protein
VTVGREALEAPAVERSDYRKDLKHLYSPSPKEVAIVDVPAMTFLMINGQGDPTASKEYQAAVEALFVVSYTVKFMAKKGALQLDYAVFPLEGLWWADDMSAFVLERRDEWKWTAMIAQPKYLNPDLFTAAVETVEKKKHLSSVGNIRFETFREGKAAQLMHLGPFAEEGRSIGKIHAFISAMGGELTGKHHEIYLSDFRRTSADKLKTIIRQPFVART